jgi:hypothetical protein
MIAKAGRLKGYRLSNAAILPDHIHLVLGCSFEESPLAVALGFLNNLVYLEDMKPVFQFGGYVGTVGEYNQWALGNESSLHPREGGGGGSLESDNLET